MIDARAPRPKRRARPAAGYRTYALAPETIRRALLKAVLRFQAIATASFLLFGLYLILFAHPVDWSIVTPILITIAAAYFAIAFVNYRQQMRLLYNTRIELDGSGVILREGRLEQRVSRADLAIVHEQRGGLLLVGRSQRPVFVVPTGLAQDGDEQVRRTLEAWAHIERRPSRNLRAVWMARLIGLGGSALTLIFANALWLVGAASVFLLAFGLWAENRLLSKGERLQPVQRMYSLAFSFVLFVMVMKACMLLWTVAGGN